MAYTLGNIHEGYDENRFQGEVRQDLICSICLKVLNEPKTCQNKEHAFCCGCLTEHLRRSSTCPECREHLTPETLTTPPRFLLNTLSDLKINCEFKKRGCPEYVRLENLQSHVNRCGYSPVVCGNEGCAMEVNKRDKENHEQIVCQFRIVQYLRTRQDEMKERQDQMMARQDEIKAAQDEIKQKLNETNAKIDAMERKQDQIDNNVSTVKENVEGIQETQAEMKQRYEDIREMIAKLLPETGAEALDPTVLVHSLINQDIIIVGGSSGSGDEKAINAVEKFNVVEGQSIYLPSMNQTRAAAASSVYNNDVIVTGGYDGKAGTDTIEILKMKQPPIAWTLFDGKLPVKLSGHAAVLYQDNIFVIGGYDWNEKKTSNAIYKVCLTPPYTSKLFVEMPQAIRDHCVEVVNDKLFIVGGTTTGFAKDGSDSVILYDVMTNKFKSCAWLPRAVSRMSTVTWGKMIIVVGGADKNGQVLNDVIMYDTETEQSEKLPSMIYKREGCSTVIMNDVMVVMGGRNREEDILNSVEALTIGSDDGWRELSGMMEKRHFASAVVIPGD